LRRLFVSKKQSKITKPIEAFIPSKLERAIIKLIKDDGGQGIPYTEIYIAFSDKPVKKIRRALGELLLEQMLTHGRYGIKLMPQTIRVRGPIG
jgi:hypothetical protein